MAGKKLWISEEVGTKGSPTGAILAPKSPADATHGRSEHRRPLLYLGYERLATALIASSTSPAAAASRISSNVGTRSFSLPTSIVVPLPFPCRASGLLE